uniref:HTH OST-type domain-containing protein n=1 Tax=Anopheles culicifacies TaxID=139723 RepID=A0A182LUL0_9DIPT
MVMSHRNKTVSVQELQRDFLDIEGFPIPFAQLGYASVSDLLYAMPDIVQVSCRNGIPVITYVSSPATEHVEQLIQRSVFRKKGNRNMYTRYSPNAYNYRDHINHRVEQNFYRPNTPKKTINQTMENKDDSPKTGNEKIRSPSQQPTAKECNANLKETCEHVNGSVMSWKPYCDMWDSVNMIDLPSDVMGLKDSIANANITQYFSEKSETTVRILHVLNPNRIWLRSVQQDDTMDQLQMQLEECYQKMALDWSLEASKVQHGMYCAAQIDCIWYRAKIVGPLIGTQVKLFFIDTGLIELVDYKNIKYLFKVFSTIRAQAIRASLACLIPKSNAWTRVESDELSASIGQKALNAYTLNINHKPSVYRNKRPSFNEKYPSFFCIEQGHFPTISELRSFVSRYFDYEDLYTRLPHFEQNGVVEKISRDTNEKMVKLYGIVSATDTEEIENTVKEQVA